MKKFIIFIFTFLLLGSVAHAQESRVHFSGPQDKVAPGSTVLISVLVNTDEPINALELQINYPKDKLKFINSDNTDSLINIWREVPRVRSAGTLALSGGLLKPFRGESGEIIKLSFEILKEGQPELTFNKSNLYLADGNGTRVVAAASPYSFLVSQDGENISSNTASFQSTSEDIAIKAELENLGSKNNLLLFITVGIILAFGAVLGYNNRKRRRKK